MIGLWSSYSNIYLYLVGAVMLTGYGLPLIIVPMHWARIFGWETLQPGNLTVFLGRSLGVFISLMAIFAVIATNSPEAKPFFFNMLLWLLGGMTLLHVHGALRKVQPKMETLEIIVWAALFVATLCFYPC